MFSAEEKNLWAEDEYGADLRLQMDVALDSLAMPANTDPECQGNACDGIGLIYDYLFFQTGRESIMTLTGLGDLVGLIGGMSIYPTDLSQPPQLGLGGSWFNHPDNLNSDGFATWIEWWLSPIILDCDEACFQVADTKIPSLGGSGDINWLLGDPVTRVPLPAAGWVLLAGTGGLTAMRRRRAKIVGVSED